jgi:hypothetical protein
MEQVFWLRDLLPEFLWIDALVCEYGEPEASRVLHDFLTAADRFNSHPKEILDGTIGAFPLIAEEERRVFVEELSPKISRAVAQPLRDVLSIYPMCPMSGWHLNSRKTTTCPSLPFEQRLVGFLRAKSLMPHSVAHYR